MRSRLAARSTRLVLAVAAAAALTATATATADAAPKDGRGQVCGTNDLTLKLSTETQAGGYYLITAKAKPGITCYLEGTIPSASFGDIKVENAEQAVTDDVKVSGSTAAYTGISPKSTGNNDGSEFDRLTVGVDGGAGDPVTFKLSEKTIVDEPIATNWHADPADAVPFPN